MNARRPGVIFQHVFHAFEIHPDRLLNRSTAGAGYRDPDAVTVGCRRVAGGVDQVDDVPRGPGRVDPDQAALCVKNGSTRDPAQCRAGVVQPERHVILIGSNADEVEPVDGKAAASRMRTAQKLER